MILIVGVVTEKKISIPLQPRGISVIEGEAIPHKDNPRKKKKKRS